MPTNLTTLISHSKTLASTDPQHHSHFNIIIITATTIIMKVLLLALTCYLGLCTQSSTSAPNHERVDDVDLNDSIDQCAAQIGLLVEETRKSFTMPIEAPGNCVMACVWDKIGLMDIDGKIIKEEMISSIRPTLQLVPNITKVTEEDFYECVDEANKFKDPCTVVSEYFKCLIKDLFVHNT